MVVGWWEKETGEGKDLVEWLFGLQWLYHLSWKCPHHAAESWGAFQSAAQQQGLWILVYYLFGHDYIYNICKLYSPMHHWYFHHRPTQQNIRSWWCLCHHSPEPLLQRTTTSAVVRLAGGLPPFSKVLVSVIIIFLFCYKFYNLQ